MTAVLRAKFYRFRRQKSSFVILIIATVFAAFMSYSLGILLGNTPFALNMQKMMSESLNGATNIYNQAVVEEMMNMIGNYELASIASYLSLGLSGDLLFVLFLFIIYFSNATVRNGFLKTIIPNVKRSHLFFSDAIILLIYTILLVLIYLAVFTAMAPIFFQSVSFGNVVSFVVFVLLKILLLFTSGLCVIVTCDFFSKRPRMIIFSALYLTILSGVFYGILNVIAQIFFGRGADVSYILPIGALNFLAYGNAVSYLTGAIVALIYLALCILLEVFVIPKKDLI